MSELNLTKAENAHQNGDLAQAKKHYDLALQADASCASALFGLGTIALQERQLETAEKFLSHAARLEPAAADIALNLAVAMNRRGNKAGAIEKALHAAELAYEDMPFSNRVCQLLLNLGQPEAVLTIKNRLPKPNTSAALTAPENALLESQILIARAYGLLGQWDIAVSSLKLLLAAHQHSPRIYRELSISAARLRDFPLAIESYQQYMQHVECTSQDYVRLADLYLMARDKQGVIEQLRAAEAAGANNAEYHLLRARVARLNDQSSEAISSCLHALGEQADHGAVWVLLMDILAADAIAPKLRQLEEAIRQSDSIENNLASLHFACSNGLQALNRYDAAFVHYKRANHFHKNDLLSRGIEYDTIGSEQQLSKVVSHFTESSVGVNDVVGPVLPIFIVGMPRSGTTLMEKMLGQLEGVTAGGEIESLSFASTQYQADVNRGSKPLPSKMTASQWQDIALQYYSRVSATAGFLTDKLPHNFNNVGLALAAFPNVRILQMRRDPRDVCLSIYSHQFPDGHAYACDFDSLAHAYSVSQRLMDYWVQLAPAQVMDVSYQELAQSPEIVGKAAVEFCGLEWGAHCLNFHESSSDSFTFSEQQVRERIHSTRIDRWRLYDEHLDELYVALQKYKVL